MPCTRALHAQDIIAIPVKTNTKLSGVTLYTLWFFFEKYSVSCFSWARLSWRIPSNSLLLCWVWPWTPSSFLGLCIIVTVQFFFFKSWQFIMKCFISGPANQNSQLWLSWSQQYNLEILYRKYQIDFMYLLNKYN